MSSHTQNEALQKAVSTVESAPKAKHVRSKHIHCYPSHQATLLSLGISYCLLLAFSDVSRPPLDHTLLCIRSYYVIESFLILQDCRLLHQTLITFWTVTHPLLVIACSFVSGV